MSADIIQFIPRPKHHREATDLPAIALRAVVPNEPAKADVFKANVVKDGVAKADVPKPRLARRGPVVDHLDTAPSEYVPSDWSEK
jgi:hypothetical protein